MLDRPEHSQEYANTWDKPEAEWGQALPSKFTGAPGNLRGRLLRLLVDRLGLRGGECVHARLAAGCTLCV
jgi:hypothetical protein